MDYSKLVKEELSGSVAKSYVSHLASYHRIQASPMYHDAALYVTDELRRMGLTDVQILQFPADGKRKYWVHRSSLGWEVKSAELRLLEPKEELLASFDTTPTSLHAHSQGTTKEGVTAELVDVGAGTYARDYKGKKVKGKFVLARGGAHAVHLEAVVKRGAAGVITDTLAYEFRKVRESLDIPDAHSYQGIWPISDYARKVRFGFSLSKRQGEEIRSYLASGKKVKLKAKVDARLFPGKYEIVTATIRGSSRPDEEVFLIAHLCHPKPGANDNASGSGLLMEIARTFTALIGSGRMERPKRTIRFLWVPETTGTVALLSTRRDMWSGLIAGLNMDMVGEDQEKCGSTLYVSFTPDSLPSYLNDLVVCMLERCSRELDNLAQIGLASNFRHVKSALGAGSDHVEFVGEDVGVPCVSFTQWPDKFYHTNLDSTDNVSEDSLRRIGWTSAMTILKLANADARTAHELACLTYSRGVARIADALGKASEELFGAIDDPSVKDKGEELAKLAKRHRSRIAHIVRREQESVRSARDLAATRELDALIETRVEDLAGVGQRGLASLESTVRSMAKNLQLMVPENPKETRAEREAKRLVPRRRFKGTLPWGDLLDLLSEENRGAYKTVEGEDPDFMSKTSELVNLVDGRRSVDEITAALSAEYGPTEHAHVLVYLRDLERLNLVSF